MKTTASHQTDWHALIMVPTSALLVVAFAVAGKTFFMAVWCGLLGFWIAAASFGPPDR